MKIRTRNLTSMISMQRPKFRSKESFLYVKDPVLMIRGFAVDANPEGIYMWKYYIPLYENVEFLHMSTGFRVGSYISTFDKPVSEIIQQVISTMDENDTFIEEESIDEMLHFINDERIDRAERQRIIRGLSIFSSRPLGDIIRYCRNNRMKLGIGQ